jgi:hypothetical protein
VVAKVSVDLIGEPHRRDLVRPGVSGSLDRNVHLTHTGCRDDEIQRRAHGDRKWTRVRHGPVLGHDCRPLSK